MKIISSIALAASITCGWVGSASAQGMPPEARDNIHKLFDNHAAVKRSVQLTETGYTALTESDDPQVARTLRSHVSQMKERLESGMGVRRWDPAYDEMVRHYKDLELKVEPTEKGLRVVMTGKTPEAIKVAQNHAQIVSKFAEKGWPEHDVEHAPVATPAAVAGATREGTTRAGGCCKEGGKCCEKCGSQESKAPSKP